MKKLITILALVLALAMIFCSCGKTETEGSAATDAATDASGTAAADGAFTPSLYHDDNGMWEGITATDYVTMGEYKGLTVSGVDPDENTILTEIDSFLGSYTTNVPVFDRIIESGDEVNIDYVGYIDDVAFDGGNTQGAGVLVTAGSTDYIDDFLTQIIGHMPGDEFDINVTFPEDYANDALSGKDAVFKTTINYINDSYTPAFEDEDISVFVGPDYGLNTCDELYDYVKNAIRENNISGAVEDKIMENFTVSEIPEILMDYQKKSLEDYYTEYAAYYSMDLNTFLLNYFGASNIDDLSTMYSEEMEYTCELSLVLQAIAETEGINVTEDEAMSFLKEAAGQDDVSEFINAYGLNYVKMIVLQDKVVEFLTENVVVE